MKALLLGFSVGGGCIAHCGSVLLPMLLCERRRRWSLAAVFLAARLLGYLLFAIASFYGGTLLAKLPVSHALLEAVVFVLLGLFLFRYAWRLRDSASCSTVCVGTKPDFAGFRKRAFYYALQAGLLTGLSLCAPFVAVISEGSRQPNLMQSLISFLWFYLGTTLMLLPVLAGGLAKRGNTARHIGLLTGLFASAIYFLQGTFLIVKLIYEQT